MNSYASLTKVVILREAFADIVPLNSPEKLKCQQQLSSLFRLIKKIIDYLSVPTIFSFFIKKYDNDIFSINTYEIKKWIELIKGKSSRMEFVYNTENTIESNSDLRISDISSKNDLEFVEEVINLSNHPISDDEEDDYDYEKIVSYNDAEDVLDPSFDKKCNFPLLKHFFYNPSLYFVSFSSPFSLFNTNRNIFFFFSCLSSLLSFSISEANSFLDFINISDLFKSLPNIWEECRRIGCVGYNTTEIYSSSSLSIIPYDSISQFCTSLRLTDILSEVIHSVPLYYYFDPVKGEFDNTLPEALSLLPVNRISLGHFLFIYLLPLITHNFSCIRICATSSLLSFISCFILYGFCYFINFFFNI
jgi:hypothetical protein